MTFKPGQFICHGKYEILALAGEGHFARVWKGREPAFGNRLVAIKESKTEALSPAELENSRKRFQQEVEIGAEALAQNIPHVVRALTLEREAASGEPLLVMDYMAGGDLARRISEHPAGMPLEEALAVAQQICAALAAFHQLSRLPIHRDVKPSNILFSSRGEAHLADFGLAHMAGSSSDWTHGLSRMHPGTPLYMAPEQETGSGALTPAADIFALGCVLFEMLTGQSYKRLRPGTPVSAVRPGLPPALDEILQKALAEDPWERYQSAADFGAELAQTAGDKVDSIPENPAQRTLAVLRPILVTILLVACVGLPLLGFVGWQLVQAIDGTGGATPTSQVPDDDTAADTSTLIPPGGETSGGVRVGNAGDTVQPGIETLAEPVTCDLQPARSRVVEYTVQPGENLACLSAKFGLTPETIRQANLGAIPTAGDLTAGVSLLIPPADGVIHEVSGQDEAAATGVRDLAEWYGVAQSAVQQANGSPADDPLAAGALLFIRGADPAAEPYMKPTPTITPLPTLTTMPEPTSTATPRPTSTPTSAPNVTLRIPTQQDLENLSYFWGGGRYRDLLQPGTEVYNVSINSDDDWIWGFSWCATDATRLSQILAPLSIEYSIDDNLLLPAQLLEFRETAPDGWECLRWRVLLTDWVQGETVKLGITYHLSTSINDGRRSYPPGTYHQIIYVSPD